MRLYENVPAHIYGQSNTYRERLRFPLDLQARQHDSWIWKSDPGRTRTCNLCFRRATPYPLGHRANIVHVGRRLLHDRKQQRLPDSSNLWWSGMLRLTASRSNQLSYGSTWRFKDLSWIKSDCPPHEIQISKLQPHTTIQNYDEGVQQNKKVWLKCHANFFEKLFSVNVEPS